MLMIFLIVLRKFSDFHQIESTMCSIEVGRLGKEIKNHHFFAKFALSCVRELSIERPGLTSQNISVLYLPISILTCKISTERALKTASLFRQFRVISK